MAVTSLKRLVLRTIPTLIAGIARAAKTARTAGVVLTVGFVAGCSASSGDLDALPTIAPSTVSADVAPTIPSSSPVSVPGSVPGSVNPNGPLIIDDRTGEAALGPSIPLSDADLQAIADGLVVTTLGAGVTTTVPNVGAPQVTLASGEAAEANVTATAQQIYGAAVRRDYAVLEEIIGDRKFRWGFVGQRRPAAQWQKDYREGINDEVKRLIALLETVPGKDERGNTVWPAIAVKDPAEWTLADEAVARQLGFQTENIAQTKIKGKYVDFRLVIDAAGVWTGMYIGA